MTPFLRGQGSGGEGTAWTTRLAIGSRRPRQLNLDITIQVVGIRPGVVRLGIDAPPDVSIVRAELRERARESRVACALPQPTVVVFHSS